MWGTADGSRRHAAPLAARDSVGLPCRHPSQPSAPLASPARAPLHKPPEPARWPCQTHVPAAPPAPARWPHAHAPPSHLLLVLPSWRRCMMLRCSALPLRGWWLAEEKERPALARTAVGAATGKSRGTWETREERMARSRVSRIFLVGPAFCLLIRLGWWGLIRLGWWGLLHASGRASGHASGKGAALWSLGPPSTWPTHQRPKHRNARWTKKHYSAQ
jgi:hypothetical protein